MLWRRTKPSFHDKSAEKPEPQHQKAMTEMLHGQLTCTPSAGKTASASVCWILVGALSVERLVTCISWHCLSNCSSVFRMVANGSALSGPEDDLGWKFYQRLLITAIILTSLPHMLQRELPTRKRWFV